MVAHHPVSPSRRLSLILLMLGVIGTLVWAFSPTPSNDDKTITSLYKSPAFSPQLCFLSASQLATLPLIDGFQSPCGSPSGAFTYDAQALGEANPQRGGFHSGSDLNGIGGGSSDLAMPIYAVARGLVVYSGVPSPDWGKVVILAHRLPDGRVVQSLYAHLQDALPRVGSVLARGELLGTMGDAGGRYLPHLHFELVEGLRVSAAQPGYYPTLSAHYLSLSDLVSAFPAPPMADCFLSVRRAYARSSMQLVSP